jgi:hypothetical protein
MDALLSDLNLRRQPRPSRRRRRQSARRHFLRNGQCAAALRAFTGAKGYLGGQFPTIAIAAVSVGSNTRYVKAAAIILQTEDPALINRAMCGHSILSIAMEVEQLAKLMVAYRSASVSPEVLRAFAAATGATSDLGEHLLHSSPIQRTEAARGLGAEVVWNDMINPLFPSAAE